jgi:hypothetical protein
MSVKQVFNTSAELDFPNVLPTLDLDFANSKTLDPRITFTRSSGGSYVGADGLIKYAGVNEARFDHDPATGESLGLLIEEARTNLLVRSDYSSNNSLSNVTLTLNATTAPDGTNTAVSMTGSVGTSVKYLYKLYSTTTTGTYTTSVFAKYNGEQYILLRVNDNTGVNDGQQRFDILNGIKDGNVANGGTATGASSTITAYPNGWYRLSVTCTFNSPFTSIQGAGVYLTGYTTTSSTNSVYLWAPQLEVGSFPTSYIPTQGSTRTRAADDASITGSNFTEWYNPIGSTFFTSFRPAYNASATVPAKTPHVFQAGNATTLNDNYAIRGAGSNLFWVVVIRSASPSSIQFPGFNPYPYLNSSTRYKAALSVNSSLISVSLNGLLNADSANTTTVNHTTPFNKLFIGSGTGGGPPYELSGHIAQLTYYPKRLPNAQLQALTS